MSLTNGEVARIFEEVADLLELQGANPFRIRAYRNAAHAVSDGNASIADLAASDPDQLTAIPGIGKDIAQKILQLHATGSFPLLEELRAEFPRTLLDVMRLPGLGPKKAALLFRNLQIQSLEDLRTAAETGRVAGLKGFGQKTQQAILEGLAQLDQTGQRFLLADALPLAERLMEKLRQHRSVQAIAVAGSCRRRLETCADLDLLAVSGDADGVMDQLSADPLVDRVLARGPTKQRVRLNPGIELDLRVVPAESYGAALQYFTGSKEHNIVIRRRAQERGLKLNEYGLFRGEERVGGATEEEVYDAVGLSWIPPELRENRGEIERAESGDLPRLIELEEIRGDLHMHTTATDGTATIRQMIEGARARGLEYIAITDHSQRVSMARGLNAERLRRHWEEIRAIREEFTDITVLCGIECDILEDARLDLSDDVLAEADWVLAVLHYGLRQPRAQIMQRLLTAVHNPHVSAIGHPSGRMIGRRSGADIDYAELFRAVADEGVLLEINANPHRLDLDDVRAAAAREHGIPIVINTDAHSVEGLDLMQYGIYQARRAGLSAAEVANTRPMAEFRRLLRNKR